VREAALLPAAPWAEPELVPEQPLEPTPFERPELPEVAGPVPGVEPVVEGAFVLEPLLPIPPELRLPEPEELAPPESPLLPPEVPTPAPPPAPPPALCANATPQAIENTAAEASKTFLIVRPPEMMKRARAMLPRRMPGKPRRAAAGSSPLRRFARINQEEVRPGLARRGDRRVRGRLVTKSH
jgi:hypothetical protein